ncbi:MAG: hypothetical protein JO339_14090 [Alphaproteobacteria bacterium]|nr:hypothetical protein [Alphaproteobacteria bacterium]
MAWRQMTEAECGALAEARLGGALFWMVIAAATVAAAALAGAIIDPRPLAALGLRYTVAVAFVGIWSALFVVMTLLHLRATPQVVSAGLLAWIAWRLAAALLSRAGWPLAVDLLGEALLAAGFCGYMAEGLRPNAYYRRRLPVQRAGI